MTLQEAGIIVSSTVAVGGVLDFFIRKWIERTRNATIAKLNTALSKARDERDEARADRDRAAQELADITGAHATTSEALATEAARNATLTATTTAQAAELERLRELESQTVKEERSQTNRLRRALELEGAIWTQKVMTGTPRFRPLNERRTPIVSVLNLKGGVGKTTLTAYLAWALAQRGYRVLLVDLDLQGSLSSLFLGNDELARLGKQERLLQHFLLGPRRTKGQRDEAPRRKLLDYAVPVPALGPHARLVAASDRLAYAELSQSVRWLLRVGGKGQTWNGRNDGRMVLRKALHAKGLYKRFDVILLDCPPLVNLCCTNALAASDYVLTPVTPSQKAIERVTPLLARIQEINANGVNPKLKPLGLVVNRTERSDLTPRESDHFVTLPDQCASVYGSGVYRFDTTIQQRVAVETGEENFTAPDGSHPLRDTFERLAEEFLKQLPPECRRPGERARRARANEGGAL